MSDQPPYANEKRRGKVRLRTFECFEELLWIILGGNSLECSNSFTSVSLLDTDVNVLG